MSSLQSKNYIKPILRIGILESLHLNLGVAILKNLLPNLSQVVMLTASANVLIQRLIERKLDLIITNDVSTEPSHVFRRLLFHEPSVLILPKSFEKDPNKTGLGSALLSADCRSFATGTKAAPEKSMRCS